MPMTFYRGFPLPRPDPSQRQTLYYLGGKTRFVRTDDLVELHPLPTPDPKQRHVMFGGDLYPFTLEQEIDSFRKQLARFMTFDHERQAHYLSMSDETIYSLMDPRYHG